MRFGFGALLVVLGLTAFVAKQVSDVPLESIGRNLESLGAGFTILRTLSVVAGCAFVGLGCALLGRGREERY